VLDHAIEGGRHVLDHQLRAGALNVVALCLVQQLIDAVTEKARLTDAVGTDQSCGGHVALRQPPSVFESGSRRLDVGGDDAVTEHVKDGDDVLLNTCIQEVGQQSVAVQRGGCRVG
jgi:hypothetical protein